MSDLAAAAGAMNTPEDLVKRSAAARAAATGSTAEEVLAAWAGGAPAPAGEPSQPAPEPAPEPEPEPEPATAPPTEAPAAPEPEDTIAQQPVTAMAQPPATPPVLTGRTEHPFALMAGAIGLLAIALLVGFIAPAIPAEGNGVYTSAVPLNQAGIDGRDVYLSEGCGACHTQLVRPIVADAGLGPVVVSDSNQVLGSRRYGPDLAHIGSRVESAATLVSVLTGSNGHPSYSGLSDTDLENLAAYLSESK